MRILIVEGRPDTAMSLARLLQHAGHTVSCASSAQECRCLCHSQFFDLLLCDVSLPDGDGWSLMAEVKKTCGLRGIAVTGHAYPDGIEQSVETSFEAHRARPVSLDRLLFTISSIRFGKADPFDEEPMTGARSGTGYPSLPRWIR